METDKIQLKWASNAALASLLNLTLLPGIAFLAVLIMYKTTLPETFARYYAVISIKINAYAFVALVFVSLLMIALGGFNSPWTWVYVISYFLTIHALFILIATWALVRAWNGQKLKKTQ